MNVTEQEKIIGRLQIIRTWAALAADGGDDGIQGRRCANVRDWIDDALALLKTQGQVLPGQGHSGGGSTWWYVCGICGTAINPGDKYCHECGRAVKWK